MNRRRLGIALLGTGVVVAGLAGGPLLYFDELAGGCPNYLSLYGQCSAASPPIPYIAIILIAIAGVVVAALGRVLMRTHHGPPGRGI